jgi:hypothetical protein
MNRNTGNMAFNAQFVTGSGFSLLMKTLGTKFRSEHAGHGSKYSLLSAMAKRETKLDLYNSIRYIGDKKLDL